MRILFIDTSSADVSISVIDGKNVLASISETIPNKHSIYTVSFIDKVIKEAGLTANDINKILVVTGPGSFTGVRIGVTIAKTYAYLKNIDIISVSSLKILALSTNHDYCLSLIDAKHDNYYLGLYDKDNNEVIPEQFINKDNVLKIINEYNPLLVSNENISIDNIKINIQVLDYISIFNYYQTKTPTNPHLVVPNYLKLPGALEEKKWLEKYLS